MATKPFPFLGFPFEIRQLIYTETLSTTLSITDHRLSRSPTVEGIAFLASRRGNWNLCLVNRLIYTETLNLRWENLTIALRKDGTRSEGDDGRHRLGNADQAFRRRIRRLEISDPECFGMCYGLRQLNGLRSLRVIVDRVDGLILDKKLMAGGKEPDYLFGGPQARTLAVEVRIVEAPLFEVGMFTSSTTTSEEVQMQWRREAVKRGKRTQYLWLYNTIPNLPHGCQVTIEAKIVAATWNVLKDLDGFRITSSGRDCWTLTYRDEI